MGREAVRSVHGSFARALGSFAPVVFVLTVLTGCSVRSDDVVREARHRIRRAKNVIRAELEGHLTRAGKALERVEAALREADRPGERLDALESLRATFRLNGLAFTSAQGEHTWAGQPVDPKSLPAAQPWHRSFRSGQVTMHIGPYLRALVVGPHPAAGGTAYATIVLETDRPGSAAGAFEHRWAKPLQLSAVNIIAPAGDDMVPEERFAAETNVKAPDGTIALRVQVRAHDPEALEEQLEETSDRHRGIAVLALWALAIALIARFVIARLPGRAWRWLAAAALVLVARGALKHFDLHVWFPGLDDAFSPSEFALDTPLDWLASPADFALTSVAWLLVVVFVMRVVRTARLPSAGPGRVLVAALGPVLAGASAAGWLRLVQSAVRGSSTPFFRADSFFPGAPATLMLVSLIVTTATAYLLAQLGMRLARRAFGWRGDLWIRLGLGAAGLAVAWALGRHLGTTHWVALAMPVLAALFARRDERFGIALPSRVLLVSVLATALAYPVLWAQVAEREGEALGRQLDTLLGAEATTQASVAYSLTEVQEDLYLKRALRAAMIGPDPQGIAFHLWLLSDFGDDRMPVMVSVLAPWGGTIDQFALTGISPHMLPHPERSTARSDAPQVVITNSEPDQLRSVVGRARIRDESGALLGHVVFTVPDPLDIELYGLKAYVSNREALYGRPLTTGQRATFAELRDGEVVKSNSRAVSRRPGGFGPKALARLDEAEPAFAWVDDDYQGSARFSPARGLTVAVRKALPGFAEAMLASARVVLVGVGLGVVVAVVWLLCSLPAFRLRLQHKIFVSYFLISVIPLVFLGLASANDARQRFERRLTDKLGNDLSRMRRELEKLEGGGWKSDELQRWTPYHDHDVLIYKDGRLRAQSRPGLLTAELLPPRLPAEAYRATMLEQRRLINREASYAGRPVWFGFEPVLTSTGTTRETVGVPLLYDEDRMDEEVTISGNVLLAAYLLTLVLVLVGGIYAANSIAQPIGLLARGTRRVARGDLDVELPESGTDELGQLITNFNAMTRELRDTTERAARVEREGAWRKMARQVAHEIKNPLTPMRLMIQQMEADIARDPQRAPEAIQRTSKVVLRQIEGLSRIAGDFANFARMPKRDMQEIDLGELVLEVTELHSGSAVEGIAVSCEVEPDLPAITWDREETRRVLINLVRNGVQAIECPPGAVELRAARRARDGATGVVVAVSDSGVGINDEDLARLFEPHFSTKTAGMGLGLAIVHRIVTDSGGAIDVESHPGAGATFTVWWPTPWN